MSQFDSRIIEDKHCFIPCAPELCNCRAGNPQGALAPDGCWKNMGMPHDHSLTADGSCCMCGKESPD